MNTTYEDWGISGDARRLFINTDIGCEGGCQYCYLKHMEIDGIVCSFNAEQLIHVAEKIFIPGKNGTIISIGCYTECWKKKNRRTTLDVVKYFLKKGNKIQISTKEEVTYDEFKELEDFIQYDNQLFLFVSMPTISRSKELEPNTANIENRIHSLDLKNHMTINTILYIKPVLEGITINDLEIYKKIIEKYKVPVVVGGRLEPEQSGRTNYIVGRTKMHKVKNNEVEKIMEALRPVALTYRGSTDVVRQYKREERVTRELKVHVFDYNQCLEIIMPKEMQSDEFADNYLPIQNKLELFKGVIKVCFEKTVWIDNLPMIYLFLLLKKSKERFGNKIEFILTENPTIEEMRFLQYLLDYGFRDLMEKLSDNKLKIEQYIEKEKLVDGNFDASKCVFACQIIDNKLEADKYINQIRNKLEVHLGNEVSDYEKEDLFFKTSIFMQESISNVFDHAYLENEVKYCGILVRIMEKPNEKAKRDYTYCSINNRIFKDNSFTSENHKRLAQEKNPYRNISGIQTMDHYVQIMVVDIGRGFLESLRMDKDAKKERGILNKAFEKGVRSNHRNTDVGGLYMLYRLLGQTGGYISVKGEYNWIQIFCGKKEETKDTLPFVHVDGVDAENTLKGVSIVGYINFDQQKCNYAYRKVLPSKLRDLFSVCDEKLCSEAGDVQHVDFREKLSKGWTCEEGKKDIICYVPKNLSKELIVSKLAKIVGDSVNAKDRTLCIVDIPEREKYKYHMIFEKSSVAIKRIILVTRNISVLAYSLNKTGKRMRFDDEFCEKYISEGSEDKGIARSITALLKEMRRHDSELFWNTVVSEQKKQDIQLYIPEEIMWNRDCGNRMSGYLDFSQACFNENLKRILLYQLYRLPVIAGKAVYYQSMDRFTEDICESINSRQEILKTRKGEYKNIHLGSVFLTGTSSKSNRLESDSKEEEEFYYFRHPFAEGYVNALLLWPSEELCAQLFGKGESGEILYGRVGKSPFLAKGGSDYFAKKHYEGTNGAVALKPAEMYDFLQQDLFWMERLVRFGHFDMIDHHDYIHMDLIAAVRKNQMESEKMEKYVKNSYDFLVASIYQGVGRSQNQKIEEAVREDVREGYREIIEKKIQKFNISEVPGLFVYFTDYETMEIVSELKEIFTEKVQRRIIPIAPIIKERTASALLLSPILQENIKCKIEEIKEEHNQKPVKVTIFSASITSSRLQRELKHILYRLGAGEVNSLCLADRQRFPLGAREREYFQAFIKTDLPELGVENACGMCKGIKSIRELKDILNTTLLQKRCEEIIDIWGKVKASDNHFDTGVKPRKIDIPENIVKLIDNISQEFMQGSVLISTDIGLVLFAIERTAITLSIDFVMSCVEEKLEDCTKILLLAAHILLFGEVELAKKDKYELMVHMYDILQKQQQQNQYTSLACVVLASQDKSYKRRLHSYYKASYRLKYFNNLDFIIANIEMLRESQQTDQDKELRYWIRHEGEEQLEYLYGIFLFTNAESGTRHRTILLKIRGLEKRQFREHDYLSAYNDVLFLEKAYEYLSPTYFHNPEQYDVLKRKMLEEVKMTKIMVEELLKKSDENDYEKLRKLSDQIGKMLNAAQKINKEIFKKVGGDDETVKGFLREIAGWVKKETGVECLVEENIINESGEGAKWYYFLEDIEREIYYLMKDMRHGSTDHKGKVVVMFKNDYMVYHFENQISEDANIAEIERVKFLKLNRPSILALPKIQGSTTHKDNFIFKRSDVKPNMFVAELRIPYIYMGNGEKKYE